MKKYITDGKYLRGSNVGFVVDDLRREEILRQKAIKAQKIAKISREKQKIIESAQKDRYNITHKIIDDVLHKICKNCQEWKPVNSIYFHKTMNGRGDGFIATCKQCRSSQNKADREAKKCANNINT